MTKTNKMPTEEARKKLGDLLNAAQFAGDHTEITRHGKTAGYLVPGDWYDAATSALAEVKALRKELAELRRGTPEVPSPASAPTVAGEAPRLPGRIAALTDKQAVELTARAYAFATDAQASHLDQVQHETDYGPLAKHAVVAAALEFQPPLLTEADLRSV